MSAFIAMFRRTISVTPGRYVRSTYPWIEIVIASGRIKPELGDMPENATFLGKPFSAKMVHDHLRERLPDGKKPEPLKQAV